MQNRNVGIGSNNPLHKLSIEHTQDNTQSGTTVFVRSNQATGANSGVSNVAGRFNAQGREGWVIGAWGNANADGSTDLANNDYLIGLVGRATATNTQCLFDAVIGVYGEAISNPACTAVPWAGYFVGGINTTGPSLFASDANLKTNVSDLENSLDKILQFKPKSYNFNTEEYSAMALGAGEHFGLIAQEAETVTPNLVQEVLFPERRDEEGNVLSDAFTYKALNYIEVIPVTIGAIQELNAKVVALEEQYASCCSDVKSFNSPSPDHELNLTLQNGEKAILGLATPNPNDGNVNINIYLPQNITAVVEVLFTDALGQPVQIAEVTERGNVQLNINTVNLSSGTYQYTLIIDGIVEATRKMVRK